MAVLSKAWAFVVRDYRIESGYKASFVMRLFESMVILVFFYFLNHLVAPRPGIPGGYFPFAMVGLAFARYFDLMLKMFSESIRLAQVTGCLEAMLSSQTGCVSIVLMSSLYSLLSGALQLVLILAAGTLAFGADLSHMDLPATVLVTSISTTIFVALGVLSAAAVVWLKKGDPITWLLGGFGSLVGGAYFPIDVMPGWMQKLSALIPMTHCLTALRLTMLEGKSVAMVSRPVSVLVLTAAILLPASIAIFVGAVRKGRKDGTLTQY